MTHEFDKDYWQTHWESAKGQTQGRELAPNPYLARETAGLVPGTALDAGCGEGAEAIWLARAGWQVTAADISAAALARASARADAAGATADVVHWVEADLTVWEPDNRFDLVTTHYAHPSIPQLAFYQRISQWVVPGGTLLVVGHLHSQGAPGQHPEPGAGHGHEHHQHGQPDQDGHPPQEASVTVASVTETLDELQWKVVTAEEHVRDAPGRAGEAAQLRDVVVRATRVR